MRLFGHVWKKFEYEANGMFVKKKLMDSFTNERFQKSYDSAIRHISKHSVRPSDIQDMRWNAHTAVWAAQTALNRPGNFVELGVCFGLLSNLICDLLDFEKLDRRFFLFDTYEGIPASRASPEEQHRVSELNHLYVNVYDVTKKRFAKYPNAELVKGVLPESLEDFDTGPISYLSVDLNYANVEIQCIELLWDRLVPGAVVVLDDYAWKGHERQKAAWDDWAGRAGTAVLTVPTGQGLIVK